MQYHSKKAQISPKTPSKKTENTLKTPQNRVITCPFREKPPWAYQSPSQSAPGAGSKNSSKPQKKTHPESAEITRNHSKKKHRYTQNTLKKTKNTFKIEFLPVHLPKSGPEHPWIFPDPHPVQVAKIARNHKNTQNQPKSRAITQKKAQIQPKTPSKKPKTPSKSSSYLSISRKAALSIPESFPIRTRCR
jgi:hypothetical protein